MTMDQSNMGIIELQEISPNVWKAKYQGNYGIYVIKIKIDGKKTKDFSCTCPSEYYPCKHIAKVKKAIEMHIAAGKKTTNNNEITFSQVLNNLSREELCNFVTEQARNNPELKKTILSEFAHKVNINEINNYSRKIREELNSVSFDYKDIEGDVDYLDMDALDQWLDKAQDYADQNNPDEAILICKAYIEEFASWIIKQESAIADNIDVTYKERPFLILNVILSMQGPDYKDLFDYCKSEIVKSKYKGTEMFDGFSNLLTKLSIMLGSKDFTAMNNQLIQEEKEKKSGETEMQLQHKNDYNQNYKQSDKASNITQGNLQVESFKKELTERLIAEGRLEEAKKLIDSAISENKDNNRQLAIWYDLKLQIAQKENDLPAIRNISFGFIAVRFNAKYYKIYRSTFENGDLPKGIEKLIQSYERNSNNDSFNASIADLLLAEKQEKRLMEYVEKHLSVDILEQYYKGFSSSFPEKTLELFRQVKK